MDNSKFLLVAYMVCFSYASDVEQFCDAALAVERSPGGQTFRAQWGSNRYAANFAFICLGVREGRTTTYQFSFSGSQRWH